MKTTIELARKAGMEQDGEMVYSFQNSDKDQDVRLVDLERFHTLARNAVLDEIADKIALMPFGDTAASFAVWIREQRT